MSSKPSSSQGTGSSQAPPPKAGTHYSITVEADGTVGGRDATKWSSRMGVLLRSTVPINYKDWRQVGKKYKDDLWKALTEEFEMNIEPHVARPLLEGSYSQFFRTQKHKYRKNIIRKAADKHDAIGKCPNDIDRVWWAAFVENEWDSKKIEQCKKNAENRSKNTISHALGRKSYSQVYEALAKGDPGSKIKRSAAWKEAHKRKNGEVLDSAKEKYKAIEEVEKKRAQSVAEHGSVIGIDDIEHDELTEVFGQDKNNRCRAMTSCSSLKKVKYGQAAKAVADHRCTTRIDELEAKLNATVKATVQDSMKELAGMYFSAHHFSPPQPDGCSSRTEGASNSLQNQIPPCDLNNVREATSTPTPCSKESATSTSGKQYVMLLSREQKEVAKGYIFPHSGVCHLGVVAPDERVVWVTEVKDPETSVYEAPQNGHYKLCEFCEGGFLIWLQTRLRYL